MIIIIHYKMFEKHRKIYITIYIAIISPPTQKSLLIIHSITHTYINIHMHTHVHTYANLYLIHSQDHTQYIVSYCAFFA